MTTIDPNSNFAAVHSAIWSFSEQNCNLNFRGDVENVRRVARAVIQNLENCSIEDFVAKSDAVANVANVPDETSRSLREMVASLQGLHANLQTTTHKQHLGMLHSMVRNYLIDKAKMSLRLDPEGLDDFIRRNGKDNAVGANDQFDVKVDPGADPLSTVHEAINAFVSQTMNHMNFSSIDDVKEAAGVITRLMTNCPPSTFIVKTHELKNHAFSDPATKTSVENLVKSIDVLYWNFHETMHDPQQATLQGMISNAMSEKALHWLTSDNASLVHLTPH